MIEIEWLIALLLVLLRRSAARVCKKRQEEALRLAYITSGLAVVQADRQQ